TVDSASVNAANKTITLTLSRPVDNGEQVSVSYTKPTSGNVVQDAAGNDAASFTGQAVNSETPDTTPPALITTGAAAPQVNGDQLVLSFSEANHLDDTHKPAPGDFTVSVDGQPNAVRTVAVDAAAKTVTLTLATPVANGQAVAVAYAAPTSGNAAIQDVAQNHAPGFPARAVDNHTPALSVPPTPVAPTPGASAQDSDKDGQPDTIEDRVPGLPGPDGAAPVIGDGNGDGIQDRMQSAVNSTHIAFSPTGASNPADAPATFVTLVGDSQDGKVSPDSDARITRLAQKDAPVLLPQGMQMPIGLLHFDATQTIADSSQPLSLSLYVDPAVLSVNGIWVQNGSTGVWTNLASAPYGGKMVMEGDRLRLDFHLPAGAHFDADGTPDGVVTVKAEVAVAHMSLSIVGQAPDAGHGGFWF
ncbi:SwmB domain-containing protein, partial [Verminephrobacter eiseniae]